MRRAVTLLFALLLVGAALAGCSAPDEPEAGSTPRVVSRPPTYATPMRPAPTVHLVSVAVEPNETELGMPVEAVARLVSLGAPGEATVVFEIVGGPSVTVNASVSGSTLVRASLTPTVGGALAVRARVGEEENTTSLLVRAPRVADLRLEARAVEPCGAVSVEASFLNAGDAPARSGAVDIGIWDTAGTPIVSFAAQIGTVEPGQRGVATAEVAELRAACEGAEPTTYAAVLVLHVGALADAEMSGVLTV